ncbi:MAG: hypothetical protein H0V17_10155 [Deltaproteobacteria bacterium]|nr:hypothetical protein [Deltaproteobacteria bacterium]
MSRVRVYITIDTECAEERGTAPPLGWDLRVWGRFANQRRALGIELIMDELERYNLRGTFFTEALGSAYFGEAGLAEVCGAMVARGHDVQLHTHPRQSVANWRTLGVQAASDDIGSYDVAEQTALLRNGVAILERCGVPAGSVLAFRAGNFGAANTTWEALSRAGLVLDSSFNPGYFDKNCKQRFDAASAGLFRAEHGVWELPITTFVERGGAHRHAQITAISRAETRALLEAAHASGLTEVTIVTHSFELYHLDSVAERTGRPSSVNVRRLRALAKFLAENRDRFEVDTCGALAQRLRDGVEAPRPRIEHVRGDPRRRVLRFASQAFKRLEQRLPWSLPV